ncbi:MAG: DNRLRE domain-containing protein [Chitinophagaceae bacterium]
MKKYIVIIIGICSTYQCAVAQEIFDFTATTTKTSASTNANFGFMPAPLIGVARVTAGSSGTPIFRLKWANQQSTFTSYASGTASMGKFSLYDIPEATSVASSFFTINFNDSSTTNVNWMYLIGNTSGSNLFSNTSTVPKTGTSSSPEFFGAIKWSIASNDPTRKLVLSFRNKATATSTISFTTISSVVFQKGVNYNMEFYCNNTANIQNYTRDAVVYQLASRCYQIWANGTRLSASASFDFPANELAVNQSINASLITSDNSQTNGVADNSAAITLGNIRMDFPTDIVPVPVVKIASPATNTMVNAGASITIKSTATVVNGTINKVEFLAGDSLLGQVVTAPYDFVWTNATAGNYVVTARATNNLNMVSTSSAVNIRVNAFPTSLITSPSTNASYTSLANIAITASAADTDGSISKVEFFNGASKLGEVLTAPYNFTWSNVGTGSYSLTTKATDNNGAITSSNTVNVTVAPPPPVSLVAVADAYVRDGIYATTNYPIDKLTVKNDVLVNYSRRAFIKFDLSSFTKDLDSAFLRVRITSANTGIAATNWEFYESDTTSWTETGINWNNQPAINNNLIATVPGMAGGNIITIPITATVLSRLGKDKKLTIRISSAVTGTYTDADFTSREHATISYRPTLLLYGTSAPSITAPADTIVNVDFWAATASNVTLDTPRVIAETGIKSITNNAPAAFPLGVTTVTWSATDNADRTATTTQAVTVVNQAPTVSITSPIASASYNSLANITITANAADIDGNVNKVEFFAKQNGVVTKLGEDITTPFSLNWNNVETGAYDLTVKATDNNNIATTSDIVNINVVAPPPVLLVTTGDAYVRDGSYATTNYPTGDLYVKKDVSTGYSRRAFLKFDLSSFTKALDSAFLRVYVTSASSAVPTINWEFYEVSDTSSWTETGITWNNQPAVIGSAIATIPGKMAGNFITIPVTAAVLSSLNANQQLSIRIGSTATSGATDAHFASREALSTDQRPILILYGKDNTLMTQPLQVINANTNKPPGLLNISETTGTLNFSAYPNPVLDNLNIRVLNLEANATIRLYNILGNKVRDIRFRNVVQAVGIGDLPPGAYLVVVQNGKQISRRTIIKQ